MGPEPEQTLPEEDMMHPDEEEYDNMEPSWSENEVPIAVRDDVLTKVPKTVRRAVRKSHMGFGPS